MNSIRDDKRYVFVAVIGIITLLVLELTGIRELVVLAKIAKTVAVIFVLMSGRVDIVNNNRLHTYCCYTLLWFIVISLIGFITYLIIERDLELWQLNRNNTE